MEPETSCSFCDKPAALLAGTVNTCASCAAALGRWLGLVDESVRSQFWDQHSPTRSAANLVEERESFRSHAGVSPEEFLREPEHRAIEFRLSSLGFLAAGLMRVGDRSAGLRAASVFLASFTNESILEKSLVKQAAQSCLEALFRAGFFNAEKFSALREEVALAL